MIPEYHPLQIAQAKLLLQESTAGREVYIYIYLYVLSKQALYQHMLYNSSVTTM